MCQPKYDDDDDSDDYDDQDDDDNNQNDGQNISLLDTNRSLESHSQDFFSFIQNEWMNEWFPKILSESEKFNNFVITPTNKQTNWMVKKWWWW